jgi:hypothetical protein
MFDEALFGRTFGGPTFAAWRTVLERRRNFQHLNTLNVDRVLSKSALFFGARARPGNLRADCHSRPVLWSLTISRRREDVSG